MRRLGTAALIGLGGLAAVLAASSALAEEAKDQGKKTTTTVVATPVYKPPLRGAPGGRIGGGTRGTGREVFVLSVLAPDHSGLTTQEQPALYWYISNPTSLPVEFTVMDPETAEPVLETRLPSPAHAGIQAIRLTEHGVRLAPDAVYRWYIAIVPDAGRRSRDILAGGTIQRVQPSADLIAKLGGVRPEALPSIYAEAGLWYDALAAMSDLIDGAPSDAGLQQKRAALISQVGLSATTERREPAQIPVRSSTP